MRRSMAESYSYLGDYEKSEQEYEKLVRDYPDNPWGYIGWGDMYFWVKKNDYSKAKELYKKALTIAKDKTDIAALQERLEDLEEEMRT